MAYSAGRILVVVLSFELSHRTLRHCRIQMSVRSVLLVRMVNLVLQVMQVLQVTLVTMMETASTMTVIMNWGPMVRTTIVPDAASTVLLSADDKLRVQEFWARRDRQLLVRRPVRSFYTFGSAQNTDLTANNPTYTDAQLKEMVQFAVNAR